MREIKFRARVRTIHNAGKTYETYTYRWVYYEPMHGLPELPQGDYVMHGQADKQSTGIKDNHGKGKEVFESDKVTRGGDMIYIVIWRKLKGQWWLREYAGEELRGWSVPLMQAAEGYIEVIDIHEEKP